MAASIETFPKGSMRRIKGELVVEIDTGRKGPRTVPISAFDEAGVCTVDGLRDFGVDDVSASPTIRSDEATPEEIERAQLDARQKQLDAREAELKAREMSASVTPPPTSAPVVAAAAADPNAKPHDLGGGGGTGGGA